MDKLVNYSSSSEESEILPSPKKRRKLPVPFEKDKTVRKEDSIQHEGRTRQVEHVEGNWASHIFFQPKQEFLNKLKDFFNRIQEKFSDIKTVESPHISLSKMFILKHHWIDNFFNVLFKTVTFKEFHIEFSIKLTYLANEDKSRHFACLLIDDSYKDTLIKLIHLIDGALNEFELPTYYENPILHMSVFWKLNEFSEEEREEISSELQELMISRQNLLTLVDKVTFKTGNKVKFLHSS